MQDAQADALCGSGPTRLSNNKKGVRKSLDLRQLYWGEAAGKSLSKILACAYKIGPPYVKNKLKALKPDNLRGGSPRLVSARKQDLKCLVEGCTGTLAEQKEVNRHVRTSHSATIVHLPVRITQAGAGYAPSTRADCRGNDGAGRQEWNSRNGNNSTVAKAFICPIPKFSRVFKTTGRLVRHIKSIHTVLAEAAHAIAPPVQVEALVAPQLLPNSSERVRQLVSGEVRPGPLLVVGPGVIRGRLNPVQLIRDNESGLKGCQSLRPRPQRQSDEV